MWRIAPSGCSNWLASWRITPQSRGALCFLLLRARAQQPALPALAASRCSAGGVAGRRRRASDRPVSVRRQREASAVRLRCALGSSHRTDIVTPFVSVHTDGYQKRTDRRSRTAERSVSASKPGFEFTRLDFPELQAAENSEIADTQKQPKWGPLRPASADLSLLREVVRPAEVSAGAPLCFPPPLLSFLPSPHAPLQVPLVTLRLPVGAWPCTQRTVCLRSFRPGVGPGTADSKRIAECTSWCLLAAGTGSAPARSGGAGRPRWCPHSQHCIPTARGP